MNRYEKVAAEYDDDVVIEERDIENEGLYYDGYAWIKKDMTEAKKACILAEEIGHHKLTVGDITDQSIMENAKQEYKARKWAYTKMVPIDDIFVAVQNGHREVYDMADYLEVDEEFLRECLEHYGIL